MKLPFLIPTSILLLTACNNPTEKTSKADSTKSSSQDTVAEIKSNCYSNLSGKDSIILSVTIKDSSANGYLMYAINGKDKNVGSIKGKLHGDTLLADYTFKSEGILSTREVAFLLDNNKWVEGYGESKEENGKMKFTDKSKLKFTGTPLNEHACNEDSNGCINDLGLSWSAIKNTCVNLNTEGVRLNPIDSKDKNTKAAYVLFLDDQSKAELFLTDPSKGIELTATGKEGARYWQNGEWKLITWKGYVLQKNGKAAYGGM